MSLTNEQKKHLKNIGHTLKPVVIVSDNGLSEGVLNETHRALSDHELIKVKLAIEDRDLRQQLTVELCDATESQLVQKIGKMVLLYRASKEASLKTSNIR